MIGYGCSMGGFSNSTVGGVGTLIRSWIQSFGFVSGNTGWRISRNGNAEFNQGTFRGPVIVTGSNGVLFYSGTPALGNLVGSVSPSGGTDPFGNVYPAGYMFTNGSLEILMSVETYLGSLIPDIRMATGDSHESVNWHVGAGVVGGGTLNGFITSNLVGPATSHNNDGCFLTLASGAFDGSSDAQGNLSYAGNVITGANSRAYVQWGSSGVQLEGVNALIGVVPGTGTGPSNPPSFESWHGLAYANGWADFGGAFQTGRYRKEPIGPAGIVKLDGMCKPGTYTNGTAIAVLPAGYRPLASHRIVCQADSGVTGANMYELEFNTVGAITLESIQGAAPGFIELTNVSFPLD